MNINNEDKELADIREQRIFEHQLKYLQEQIMERRQGEEYQVRKFINESITMLRNEGYSYRQVSDLLGKIGETLQPREVRERVRQNLLEALFDKIEIGDYLDRLLKYKETYCDKCKMRDHLILPPKPFNTPNIRVLTAEEVEAQKLRDQTPSADTFLTCLPIPENSQKLDPRPGVAEYVYQEGSLEHPAIPGLMLSLDQRLLIGNLEIVSDSGEKRTENLHERLLRTKWRRAIPPTPSSTESAFTNLNPDLFPGPGPSGRP